MRGLLTDPGFMIGMGLLANGGPSRSPVNPMRGAMQGLLASSQIQEQQQKRAMEQARIEQEMAYRRALEENMLAQQAHQTRQHELDVSRFEYDKNKGPEWSDPYEILIGGKPTLVQRNLFTSKVQPLSGGGVTVNTGVRDHNETPLGEEALGWGRQNPDGSWERAPAGITAAQALKDGYAPIPQEAQTAATDKAKIAVKSAEALRTGTILYNNYMKAFDDYQSGWSPVGGKRELASDARKNFVAWYAKNILGTPGTEPNDIVMKRADQIIPDFAGVYDRSVFGAKMQAVKDAMSSLAPAGRPNAPMPNDGRTPSAMSAGVTAEEWEEMTPAERDTFQ